MPLLKVQTSVSIPVDKKKPILAEASRILSEVTGKPERYVMVTLEEGAFLMGGTPGPAAFLDVRGIGGLTKSVNAELSKRFGEFLKRELNIEPLRVYLTFTDVAAQDWGWNSGTFA
jgi:phenylpyruvate tautomerase PptA (4-oxalocrotonate tautomerase family)